MDEGKKAFQQLSDKLSTELPFSLHYNWWNEVVEKDWDLSSAASSKEIKGIWPYFQRKKGPWKMLCQPPFTPYGGPIFNYPGGQKTERRYSWEQKVIDELIEDLGEYSELLINCNLELKNTLPFIWKEFEDKKKYTYLLSLDKSEEEIWDGFRENIRRQIRKAEKSLIIKGDGEPELLAKLLKESYASQKESYPIEDEAIYQRIKNYLSKYDCGDYLQAVDQKGEVVAMIAWIYDHHSAYYLIGGAAQEHKNSGAMSLLLWEAIRKSKSVRHESGSKLQHFNFEGSMLPSIEKYLRGFGGQLTPYSCLIHNPSTSLKVLRKLKG